MKKWLIAYLLYPLLRLLLSLRYRIVVRDPQSVLTTLRQDRTRGILFLPNHSAYIDPIILMSIIGKEFQTRPAMIEDNFYLPIIQTLMEAIRAMPVPDFSIVDNLGKKQQYLQRVEREIISGLPRGESFLFYPSGRLKRQAAERLEGCSGLQRLLRECGQAHVVLIRISGLWGSRFSYGTGETPDFLQGTKKSCVSLLLGGVVLLPRRLVTIDFGWLPTDARIPQARLEHNRKLEEWYNAPGEESLSLVPYALWCRSPQQRPLPEPWPDANIENLPREFVAKVMRELARVCQRSADAISLTDELGEDLGLDSIEIAEVVVSCKENVKLEGLCTFPARKVEDLLKVLAQNYKDTSVDFTQN